MSTSSQQGARAQAFFDRTASWWDDVYSDDSLAGEIYREREQRVLTWVDELQLPARARVLEIGCGAGRLAAALGERGMIVDAVDASAGMVEKARAQIAQRGLGDRVSVQIADAEQTHAAGGDFDLVVAVGLLPWVASPARVVAEAARAVRPGGWLILTADNAARVGALGEPGAHPLFIPLLEARRRLRPGKASGLRWRMHLPRQVDAMVTRGGLRVRRRTTLGFGPFTLRDRAAMSDAHGLRVHRLLSALAQDRLPLLRRMGWHYLLLAQRPAHDARTITNDKEDA